MTAMGFAALLFVVAFGATLLGVRVRRMLPERYADESTKSSVQTVVGQMSLLTAAVLGLVTASAKSDFNSASALVSEAAIRLVTLDRILADFGPRAAPLRASLKQMVEQQIVRMQGTSEAAASDDAIIRRAEEYEAFYRSVASLTPESDAQTAEIRRALDIVMDLLRSRWMLSLDMAPELPVAFLLFVLAWLVLDFFYVGLYASDNAFVIVALAFVAICLASAMFLMLELEDPLTGFIRVSAEPLKRAVAVLGR